jgi:titin
VGAGNLISGNGGAGLQLDNPTNVWGNLIGTDVTGQQSINNIFGVLVVGSNITVGGTGAGQRNVISGNSSGVEIDAASGSQIIGNYIGLSKSGIAAVANGTGVEFLYSSSANMDDTRISSNVISGNSTGVSLTNGQYNVAHSNGTIFTDNIIGLNVAGTAAVPNGRGIVIDTRAAGQSDNSVIGQAGHPNVISGNSGDGIDLLGPGTLNTSISGNSIGTNKNLDGGLGNGQHGVMILASSHNSIGAGPDPAPRNVIMNNGGDGIRVDDNSMGADGNKISENSIDGNGGLGITLIGQANDYQAAPVLAAGPDVSTPIVGTISGPQNTQFTIEFFASPVCDPTGHGEGRDYVGSKSVNTGGTGTGQFSLNFVPAGRKVTATATDPNANTSEFSNCVSPTVATPTPSPTPTPTHSATPTPTATPIGQTPSPTPTSVVTPTPTPVGTSRIWGDVDCGGDIAPRDAQAILKNVLVQNPLSQTQPCPAVGSRVTVDGVSRIWGDVDCGGDIAPRDGQAILKDVLVQNALSQTQPCPAVGSTVQVVG